VTTKVGSRPGGRGASSTGSKIGAEDLLGAGQRLKQRRSRVGNVAGNERWGSLHNH